MGKLEALWQELAGADLSAVAAASGHRDWWPSLRMLLVELQGWQAQVTGDARALDRLLGEGEAGGKLARMRAHSARLEQERLERDQREARARDEKLAKRSAEKALAQQRNEERKRASAARKAEWVGRRG